MATTLTGEGQIAEYNGVVWDPATTETVSIVGTPVYDQAQRTVIYMVWAITLQGYVSTLSPHDTTDRQVADIRAALTRPGGILKYENKGFGNLRINLDATSSMRDVIWGPKPRLLEWHPLGTGSSKLKWMVEVAIPDCDGARYVFGLLAFNFNLTFTIDKAGYTTRTYKGYLQIPQTRRGAKINSLSDAADQKYREMIIPRLYPGSERVRRDFALSEDKCRLDFTIVDEDQPPQPLPAGCVSAKAEHTIASTSMGMMQWGGTLRATYELARGLSKSLAYDMFYQLFRDRLNQGQLHSRMPGKNGTITQGQVFITGITCTDSMIYGREAAQFSLTYRLATLPTVLLKAAGLWRPVQDDSTWEKWARSMDDTRVNSPYGISGLMFSHTEDAIVDLCLGTKPVTYPGAQTPRIPPAPPLLRLWKVDKPTPDSWLHYELWTETKDKPDLAKCKPLPPRPVVKPDPRPNPPGFGGGDTPYDNRPASRNTSRYSPNSAYVPDFAELMMLADTGPNEMKVQYRKAPSFEVYLMGKALRVGFPIAPPKVVALGGVPAYNDDDESCFVVDGVGANIGFPVFYAAWRKRYFTKTYPRRAIFLPTTPTASINDIDK